MAIKIALAGNPNSGKTTMFNDLIGSNQYVGNWPGVTVEKKEGRLKGAADVVIQDLPGIYSLSPYTLEEVVARGYLVSERPDAILNIVDATNIERNLYLTTQLAELGIPMVLALNMIDVTRKNGDRIDLKRLGAELGCEVVETSALKGEGSLAAARRAAELARWYAIKLFERDDKAAAALNLPKGIMDAIERVIKDCEAEMDDDSESIITNQRYAYINRLVSACVHKGRPRGALTVSDKIDRIVTNRILALPIFVLVMWLVYYVSVTTIGDILTNFTNDTFVGEWIQAPVVNWLSSVGVAGWLVGLIGDGIIGGVGAVIGFVPQMLVLFFMLSILEDVGYMARVAFIMDRIFRKFGLSGKSFIPMLIGSGCGVPGVMASRTIENDRDRKMTIMTTTFIPCGAKIPIVALVAAALFHNAAWVTTTAYFVGVAAVIISGILLKKTRMFAGDPAPFVMELPAYHAPAWTNVLHSMWERGWSFIKRAGTVILVSSILIWFTSNYGWQPAAVQTAEADAAQSESADALMAPEASDTQATGALEAADGADWTFGAVENSDHSILGHIGSAVAPVFRPLGFDNWQSTVATVMGLVAKEEVVNVFGVLFGVVDDEGNDAAAGIIENEDMSDDEKAEALSPIMLAFEETSGGHGQLAAFSFLLFNLLCAPCFAAMGAIKREMNNWRWTAFAIAYQCVFAYITGLIVYQLGLLFSGAGFTALTAVAIVLVAGLAYLVVRRNRYDSEHLTQSVKVGA